MKKFIKQKIIPYIILIIIIISISNYFVMSITNILFGEEENTLLTYIPTIYILISMYTYLAIRNILLIILWIFCKILYPQYLLTKFFKTTKQNLSQRIIILLISIIVDYICIKFIQENSDKNLIDITLYYINIYANITINFLTLYLYWFICDKIKIFKSKSKIKAK